MTDPTPEQVYNKVAGSFFPGLLFTFGLGALAWWLAGRQPFAAKGVFIALAVLVGFDVFGALVAVAGGIAVRVMSRREGRQIDGERWMVAATVVKVVDASIGISVMVFLISRVWR